jgi:hypothetical protein
MKSLSEQLTEMGRRVKKAGDVVSAAQAKNRAALDSQRDQLKLAKQQKRKGARPFSAYASAMSEGTTTGRPAPPARSLPLHPVAWPSCAGVANTYRCASPTRSPHSPAR